MKIGLTDHQTRALISLMAAHKDVVAVYLFGSRADGTYSTNSDYDFGILFSKDLAEEKRIELFLLLAGKLTTVVGSNAVDVVCMNDSKSSALLYAIVTDGVIVFSQPNQDLTGYEIARRHEYFDFIALEMRMEAL